jgi:hypothetical protein
MINKSYPRFLVVWTGQLISGLGTGMTAFGLGIYVFEQTKSAVSFAVVMLTLFVPSILLAPLGGILADRFDRRLMIIIGDAGSALAVLFLLGCFLTGSLSLWKIYLGIAAGSAFTALQGPAYKASLSDLLSESQYAKAGGLMQLASSAKHLIAPAAAGFLLTASGLEAILLLDISTFGLAVAAALCMPRKELKIQESEVPHLITNIKEGWKDLTGSPNVTGIVFKLAIVTFFVGYIQTLFTPMMLAITDVKTLGTIQSVSALGMFAGSILISIAGLGRDLRLQLSLGLGLGGLFLAAMGLSTYLSLITIFLFLFFLCLPLINTSAEVLIRTGIPNHKQGRIWGFTSFLSQTGYIAAYLSAGFLSDRIFSPLLTNNGFLAHSIGRVIGTGPGRGSALILIICGLGLIITAVKGENKCCSLELSEKI